MFVSRARGVYIEMCALHLTLIDDIDSDTSITKKLTIANRWFHSEEFADGANSTRPKIVPNLNNSQKNERKQKNKKTNKRWIDMMYRFTGADAILNRLMEEGGGVAPPPSLNQYASDWRH